MVLHSTLPRLLWIGLWTRFLLVNRGFWTNWGIMVAAFFLITIVLQGSFWLMTIILLILTILMWMLCVLCPAYSPAFREVFQPRRHTFMSEGLLEESIVGQKLTLWSAIRSWRKMGGCYVFFFTNESICIIPQSAIAQAEVLYFETLLYGYLPSKP
jgi:hypothetical protein